MKSVLARAILIMVAGIVLIFDASPAAAQTQPGLVPPVGQTEPPRIEPSPPRIPPDFLDPNGKRHAQPKRVFDAAEARKEAFEISFLANQIPDDVEKVKKNILPKDLIAKLKRIEKLSKKLRAQVAQ
jgi:hypothetical protein